MDWSTATLLSLIEFDVCWEWLALGETPWQLDPPSPGRTREERARIVGAALDGLGRRGLADHGRPSREVVDLLRLLATAELTLDGRLRTGTLVAGIAARRGDEGVLAVRQRDAIGMLRLPGWTAAAALVDLFGPIAPGRGCLVNLPADVLDCARAVAPDDSVRFADELVRCGVPELDAQTLVHMCRHADGRGQFGASSRSAEGRIRRAPYVIGLHHTPAGHYGQLRRCGVDGRAVVTIGPLSRPSLLRQVDELAGTVHPQSR